MKGLLFRATESVVGVASCLVLFGGVASAQSIDTTGPGSTNIIKSSNECKLTVKNNNNVTIVNNNPQYATSGESSAEKNTTVGSVSSGSASNNSSANFGVTITNDTGSCLPAQPTKPSNPVTPNENNKPSVTPAATTGGRGAGEVAAVTPSGAAQVVVPEGGVGAGSGGQAYLSGLIAVTFASGALAVTRLQRHVKGQL